MNLRYFPLHYASEFLLLAASTVTFQSAKAIANLITAKILSPNRYGILNALLLIMAFSPFSHLGIFNGMERELPYYRGKKNFSKAENIQRTAWSTGMLLALIASLLTYLLGFILITNTVIRSSMLFLSLLLVFSRVYQYLIIHLQTSLRFNIMSYQQFIASVVILPTVVLLVNRYGLCGYLVAQTVCFLITSTFMASISSPILSIKFDSGVLTHLLKVGFPIMITGILYELLLTTDKWLTMLLLSKTELGYYSLSAHMTRFLLLFPYVITKQTYPRMLERYGSTGKYGSLMPFAINQTKMIIVIVLPIVIIIYLFCPAAIRTYLPQYEHGITAMQIIAVGLVVFPLSNVLSNFLLTVNKQIRILLVQSAFVLFNLILSCCAIGLGSGIEGVALATAITYALYTLTLFFVSWQVFRAEHRHQLKQ